MTLGPTVGRRVAVRLTEGTDAGTLVELDELTAHRLIGEGKAVAA